MCGRRWPVIYFCLISQYEVLHLYEGSTCCLPLPEKDTNKTTT
uniref:Uncharacterized protein n=1 Tax=Rhizophora mucronata TaxID=61149 RepID=A0A2P2NIF8_RHIMU